MVRTMKILIADDSTTIQKVIQLAFEEHDADLVFVSNYIELVSELKKATYSAVICDSALTGLDEAQDFSNLKTTAGRVPIVLLKGSFESSNQQHVDAAGFSKVLKKPFDATELVSIIMELTGHDTNLLDAEKQFSMNDFVPEVKAPPPPPSESLSEYVPLAAPSVGDDKGQKAFEEDLSISSFEELSAASEETSPALNLGLAKGSDDLLNATSLDVDILTDGFGHDQVANQKNWGVNSRPPEIDLNALAAQLMPTLKEQIHNEMRLFLKQHIGNKMDEIVRNVIREELHKLMDQKNSMFVDQ